MGSCIPLRVALKYPSRVSALVLIAATSTAATTADKQAFEYVRQVWTSTPSPSETIMNLSISAWGGPLDVESARSQRIKREWVTRHSGAENVDAIFESINERDDITDRLANLSHPVLSIHGKLDSTWKLEEAMITRDALVNAKVRLEILEDCGHLVIYARDSEDVGILIRAFVEQVMANK